MCDYNIGEDHKWPDKTYMIMSCEHDQAGSVGSGLTSGTGLTSLCPWPHVLIGISSLDHL